jgi:hypothetical protein
MVSVIRAICALMLLFTAGKAFAQIGAVIDALPADRLYVASISNSIAGYNTMTEIEKVRALRLYVYQHTSVSDPIIHDQVVNLPLKDAYSMFESGLGGGVMCGGTAIMLSRVYKAAGFNSWVYNFGAIDGPSHVTTLVEVNGDVIVQDAYFNFEYVDDDGMPIPFPELITRILRGAPPTAKVIEENKVIVFRDLASAEKWIGDTTTCQTVAHVRPWRIGVRCNAPMFLSRYLDIETGIYAFLESRGWSRKVEYLMLFPLGLVSMYTDTIGQAESLLDEINRRIRDLPLDTRLKMYGLPSISTLTKQSDIAIFMKDGVPEDIRLRALKAVGGGHAWESARFPDWATMEAK